MCSGRAFHLLADAEDGLRVLGGGVMGRSARVCSCNQITFLWMALFHLQIA